MPASPRRCCSTASTVRALMLCGVAGGLDPALGVGDVVVGTSHIQHDYGTHREGYFLTIQPGSRPSRGGDDWKPGYPEGEPLVARLREAVAGPRAGAAATRASASAAHAWRSISARS